jgi:hypothetical protein
MDAAAFNAHRASVGTLETNMGLVREGMQQWLLRLHNPPRAEAEAFGAEAERWDRIERTYAFFRDKATGNPPSDEAGHRAIDRLLAVAFQYEPAPQVGYPRAQLLLPDELPQKWDPVARELVPGCDWLEKKTNEIRDRNDASHWKALADERAWEREQQMRRTPAWQPGQPVDPKKAKEAFVRFFFGGLTGQ